MKLEKVYYRKKMPSFSDKQACILIFDRTLLKTDIKRWILSFPKRYSVRAGEHLKEVKNFPGHITNILKFSEGLSKSEMKIVALGGGSVGDFAGFVASVLKRGTSLIHIPSTWLAAIDSAHGGKTALNVKSYKNQIGSFYAAEKVFICKDLLFSQPQQRAREAWGEMLKTAILSGPIFYKKTATAYPNSENIWRLLPLAVQHKLKIVSKDPYETKGLRVTLNLGHTLGHALEIDKKMPHGTAVLIGTLFSARWSYHRGLLKKKDYEFIRAAFPEKIKSSIFFLANRRHFLMDKKMDKNGRINFVFIQGLGKPCVQKVLVDDVVREIKRQAKNNV